MLGLGLDDYGSDSDGDGDSRPPSPRTNSLQSSNPSLSLQPPQKPSTTTTKPKRPPKKITIGLPAVPTGPDDDDDEKHPPPKKPRLQSGAGLSSLLSMLPPPKQTRPTPKESAPPPSERVLGGGQGPGLVFNTVRASTTNLASSSSETKPKSDNVTFDFFSLGPAPSTPTKSTTPSTSTTTPTTLSSAPQVDEFIPPEPTPADPYPGYYLLPSGSWAAYDPGYYQSFYKRWQNEYDAHIRVLEKRAVKGFEGLETAEAQEIDAQKEMEKAKQEIQEREERKAVTKGAEGQPAAPKMNIQGAKLGARARSRHQLTTLLTEAYTNREALEEKIAEGRRNRKEAGNKYGF